MTLAFTLQTPRRIIFGRGVRTGAAEEVERLGRRVLLVRGRSVAWADTLQDALRARGLAVEVVFSGGEPEVSHLVAALNQARAFGAGCVVAVGGGAALDLGKAVAALAPGQGDPLDHLEVVGKGLPLTSDPLPFVAMPTTSGTGAEATKNAVIGLPEHDRKVSLRDDRMLADLALVDPALTDGCPRGITLASGLDAVTQVVEPYLSCKATPLTDALCRDAIPRGLRALRQVMARDDPDARDALSLTSLYSGIALANAGLGAVHGFAGVIGGTTGAAHGAICGRLLVPVLRANADAGAVPQRMDEVRGWIAQAFDSTPADAFDTLERWIDEAGLPRLRAMGGRPLDPVETVAAAQGASSMKGNPVVLSEAALHGILRAAGA
ncbi:iron-containing alcohol dehydrogenase [Thalassococcus sp. BH17M4-6]|uniref:iron-containing alcohol dehydrogenase n=1 Tax=Thalassococcus sp. BH17M4-6 TaxID=3413148 RepID=UPI003BD43A97